MKQFFELNDWISYDSYNFFVVIYLRKLELYIQIEWDISTKVFYYVLNRFFCVITRNVLLWVLTDQWMKFKFTNKNKMKLIMIYRF